MMEQPLLILIAAVFLLVILFVGYASKRFVRTTDDFYRGGRRVPWWVAGISIYMGSFSALAFVAFASIAFSEGLIGFLLGFGFVLAYVLAGLFFAHRWHRAGVTTPVEYLERRFGPESRRAIALISVLFEILASGLRLYAFAILLHGIVGFPIVATIVVFGIAMAIAAWSGGLWAVVLGDAVQFVILLAGLVPLFVMSIVRMGGWEEFLVFLSTDLFSVRGEHDWGWLFSWLAVQAVAGNFGFAAIQRFSSVRTEADARKAAFLAAGLLVPLPFLAMVPALICFYLLPGTDPQEAFGVMVREALPIGLVGLMVGAIVAATVSELESAFNICSGILTSDVYKRFLRPTAEGQELLWVGRAATLGVAATAIAMGATLALLELKVFDSYEALVSHVFVTLYIPFLAGILVPRMSELGFAVVVGGGLALSGVLWLAGWTPSDVRTAILGASLIGVVLVSLVMPARGAAKARIAEFFERLSAPRPAAPSETKSDLTSVRVIAVTILALGAVAAFLPFVSGSSGTGQIVEAGVAIALVALGAVLLAISSRTA